MGTFLAVASFWSWEFWEKPLQGAVQAVLILFVGWIGLQLSKKRAALAAALRNPETQLKILRGATPFLTGFGDLFGLGAILFSGLTIQVAIANNRPTTLLFDWIAFSGAVYQRLRTVRILAETIEEPRKISLWSIMFGSKGISPMTEFRILATLIAIGIALYLGVSVPMLKLLHPD